MSAVAQILTAKGRDVVTIQPHRTLGEAACLLVERHIGSVVVAGGDRDVLGILSERDIVRVMALKGRDALKVKWAKAKAEGFDSDRALADYVRIHAGDKDEDSIP